jgi:DNA-directed RNA polymerase beta subunit
MLGLAQSGDILRSVVSEAPAGAPAGALADREELKPAAARPPITRVDNAALTQRDMLALVSAAVDNGGLVGHNLAGYNELVDGGGLNKIITQSFDIDRTHANVRVLTEADRKCKSHQMRIQFYDLRVGRPTCTTYLTGQFTDLYPRGARLTGIPYSGAVTLGATVTVRASFTDGRVEERVATIPPFQIGAFPVMVGSGRCHTANCTRAALKELGEDPTDRGGYFIMKRGEYVVDLLENIRYNSPHFHLRMKPNEHVRAEFLSQPGGAFENSSQVRLRYMTNGQITIEINSTKFEKVRLPFFLVFRMFGWSDAATAAAVVFDPEDGGPITARMLDILERAFQLADATFAPLIPVLDVETLVRMTAERVVSYLTNPSAYQSSESAIAYLNEDLLGSPTRPGGLDKILLPHMGQTLEARTRKLRFLGLLIHKLLLVHLGALPPTDRDSYRNKRVHGAGVSLAKAFKTQVNNSIVIPITRAIRRELKNNPWDSITEGTLVDTFRNAVSMSDLNRAMEQAITSGNKTIVVRRRAATNRVSSQALERKNSTNVLSALRTVVTQNAGNASKQTERADMMRRVHPTYLGFICVAQSADTGENVGMRKQLAITASVCTAGEALPLKLRLLADSAVVPLDDVDSAAMLRERLARVFVNGEWIGCVASAHELVARYRALRRAGRVVDSSTTIAHEPVTDEVEFWLDVGRLRRPLLIVDSNIAEYDAARRARHAWRAAERDPARGPEPPAVEFVQNVRFTPEMGRQLVAGALGLSDLLRDGVIEYITPEEQENCLIAESIIVLQAARGDVTRQFTHCDVEQAIFGLAAHVSPYGHHTQPTRVTYETNHARSTGGWYALNFPFRTDKNRFFQFYNEVPLVRTLSHKFVPANGTNVIIAYMSYGGDNQEDSAIVSQASTDRGLFAGAFFRYELAELEKGESFACPDRVTTKNLKPNACYEKLVDGFIRRGSVVQYGDVLIGRVARLNRSREAGGASEYTFTDRSIVYKQHEPAVVEEVLQPRGANDELFGVVKLRYERPLRTGDKLSTRSGNKCLTPSHEVLTSNRGWVPISEVTIADSVATLVDGQLVYAQPSAVHTYDHDGLMYELSSQMVDLCATPNHRMWVKPRHSDVYGFVTADDVFGRRVQYQRDAELAAPDIVTKVCPAAGAEPALELPMDAWLQLLGMFIGDGYVQAGRTVYICCVKRRKIDYITDVVTRLGVSGAYAPKARAFVINSKQVHDELAPLSVGAIAKRLPEYVWALSQRQARVLLEALVESDGHRAATNTRYCTSSAGLADDVQRLALHAGWSANIFVAHPAGFIHERRLPGGGTQRIVCNVDALQVSLNKARNRPMVNHPAIKHQHGQTERWVDYKGPVHCITVPGGIFYVRRNKKPVWTGNSIVASVLQQSDMPFTESGLTPDLIINTNSIPSRQTIGQLIETTVGLVCARRGAVADGTAFLPVDHRAHIADLLGHGFRYNGRDRLYNGMTGEYFDAAIFIGPTAEQRLQKFVLDDEQSVAGSGPTDATTGQPLGGKHVHGGLRIGEMEHWGLESHGSMINLFEKTSQDSDGRTMHVCRGCSSLAAYNEYQQIYSCKTCGELADISAVDSSKSAILFHEELAAANIRVRLGLRPRAFEEQGSAAREAPAAAAAAAAAP